MRSRPYAYLIPLLAVAFVLALILQEIPMHTRAHLDSAQAGPPQEHAAGAAATSTGTPRQPTRSNLRSRPPSPAASRPATCPHRQNSPPAG
jgi:hypothetical protein